jgi:GIY-YIG catalytic domain
MTIGIYLLKFTGTDKVYIGKSDNIERRLGEHYRKLRARKSPKKLQDAYDKYGPPSMDLILECCTSELVSAEQEVIGIWDSVNNGFNSISSQLESCLGEDSPRAKHTNEVYYSILLELISPGVTYKEISLKLDVSEAIIRHIACLQKHLWLKEAYPEEYSKLEHIYHNSGMRRGGKRGVDYPDLLSPDGELYKVTSPTSISRTFNLNQGAVSQVLNGKRLSHKGWKLA